MFSWVHVKFPKKIGHDTFIIILNKKKCIQKMENQSCSHGKTNQTQKTVAWIFAPNEPSRVNTLSKAIRFPTKGSLLEAFQSPLTVHSYFP